MKYFIIFHDNSYCKDKERGLIWTPKRNQNNKEVAYWSTIKRIRRDDVIFSICNKKLVSLNYAKDGYLQTDSKNIFKEDNYLDKIWILDTYYNELKEPIDIKDKISEIKDLFEYGYFELIDEETKIVKGYIHEIPNSLGKYIMNLIKENKLLEEDLLQI